MVVVYFFIFILCACKDQDPRNKPSCISSIIGLLREKDYVTEEIVSYLNYRYLEEGSPEGLMALVSRKGLDVYHDLLYVHNSYITCDLVREPVKICDILYEIGEKVDESFVSNKFQFFPKLTFPELETYIVKLKSLDHLVDSAFNEDKGSIETLYDLFEKGFIREKVFAGFLESFFKKGVARSASLLGEMYMYGHGVDKSYEKAMKCFYSGIQKNEAASYNGLGKILIKDEYKNLDLSRQYLLKAASKGLPPANFNLYLLYEEMFLGSQVGKIYLMAAVEKGYLPALFRYGKALYTQKKFEAAIPYFLSITEFSEPAIKIQKDSEEMFLKKEYGKALALCLLGAEMGLNVCIRNTFYLLKHYKGLVASRDQIFFKLLQKYVYMGINTHLVDLGDCYFYGKGVKRSYSDAFSYYLSASLHGSGRGFYSLSYMYQHGLGCKRDPLMALRYMVMALDSDPNAYLVVLYTIPYYLLHTLLLYFPYKGSVIATVLFVLISIAKLVRKKR